MIPYFRFWPPAVPRSAPNRPLGHKRFKTLTERGLDFVDAVRVFEGVAVEIEDTRKDYGEKRIICFGRLEGRIAVIGYTQRGASVRHVFSMRKANVREQARIAPLLEI